MTHRPARHPARTPPGPHATRVYVDRMLRDYPDLAFTVDELLSQGRTVALRASWRGTHRETGAPLRQHGLVMVHVDESGRIAERWSAYAAG